MTTEGTIIVDGVLASCSASIDHDIFHFAMAPIRWFPEMAEFLFGLDLHDGMPVYVKTAEQFGQWTIPRYQSTL